ncbi:hypothetical protein THRCLA_00671 [Thraustotheca clavata]|uniref:M96 mating-specific protein family n=1 Tax=Thraustotheca clavata TaxID=74557 RepID=A0A1W0AAP4_9STRA|nr:hypothetical protein THRCLA_00671 [Thraustotheca clavata]
MNDSEFITSVFADFDDKLELQNQPRYIRQKHELIHLRQQVSDLTLQLEAITNTNDLQTPCGYWEKTAKDLRVLTKKSKAENRRLKRALEDQIHIAKEFERLLIKRPRLAEIPKLGLSDCKLRRLPRDFEMRSAAFHAIVDDAHENLQSLLIRTRILEADTKHRIFKVNEQNDMIQISVEHVKEIDSNPFECSEKIWAIWTEYTSVFPQVRMRLMERFGNNGIYVRILTSLDGVSPCVTTSYAIKRYIQQDCVKIVLKSILEDELYPPSPELLVGNHTACAILQSVGPNKTCRRVAIEGKLSAQAPLQNPLNSQELSITDFVFKTMRPILDTLDFLAAK